MTDKPLRPYRPYLIRAIYGWLVDNELTPQLVVDTTVEGVVVPREHVKNGRIVLNIAPSAVRDLSLGDEAVEFDTRFGGHDFWCVLPVASVVAVVARENAAGMPFPQEDFSNQSEPAAMVPPTRQEPSKRASLRVVK